MKLHLPKALAAAVMALFAIPNALAETVTVDGVTYADTTVLTTTEAPSPTTGNFLFSMGGEYKIQKPSTTASHWACDLSSTQTLIAASATREDETTSTATKLFFDTGDNGTVTVNANLVVGRAGGTNIDRGDSELRFWNKADGSTIILKGEIRLVNDATQIWNQNGTQYLEGAIDGAGKTLTIKGETSSALLRLSGGGTIGTLNLAESGSSVTLSATKHDGTTEAASKEYTITTLNSANSTAVLTVESAVTLNLTNYEAGKLSNAGTLNLTNFNGGTLTNSGTSSVLNLTNFNAGALTNEGTLNLTKYSGGTLTNTGTVKLAESSSLGTELSVAGTLDLSSVTTLNVDVADSKNFSRLDSTLLPTQNGYYTGKVELVGYTGTGSVSLKDNGGITGAGWLASTTISYENGKLLASFASVSSFSGFYCVVKDTETTNTALSADETARIVLGNSATLGLKNGWNDLKAITSCGGTINIESGASLSAANLQATAATKLDGAGQYIMSSPGAAISNLGNNVSLADTWTGVVTISGGHSTPSSAGSELSNLAKSGNSTIEFKGFSGYDNVENAWMKTMAYNVKLTNVGDTVAWSNNAWVSQGEVQTGTFTGKWSGEGTFMANVGSGHYQNYKYTGDISEWTGEFRLNNGTTNLTFSDSATTVNAAIGKNGGTLNLIAGANIAFNKSVNVSSISSAAYKLTMTSGSVSGTATIGGLTKQGNEQLMLQGTTTLTGTTSVEGGELRFGNMNSAASGTVQEFSVDKLSISSGATVCLNYVKGTMTTVELNGGILWYRDAFDKTVTNLTTKITNLTVSQDSFLQKSFKGILEVGKLTGSASLAISNQESHGWSDVFNLNVLTIENYHGEISSSANKFAFTVSAANQAEGKVAKISSAVTLADGFAKSGKGELSLTGTATLTGATISEGTVKFSGSSTTLNGTLNITGGSMVNTAEPGKDTSGISLGTSGKILISNDGLLTNDGFTYTANGGQATITGNGESRLYTHGNVTVENAVMEKTVNAEKDIAIALTNVALAADANTGTTTLKGDKQQTLSKVTVGSGATVKMENSHTDSSITLVEGGGRFETTRNFTGTLAGGAGATLTAKLAGTTQTGTVVKVDASVGSVDLLNTSSVTVTDMVIGEGKTVGVYTGNAASADSEGNLAVTNLTVKRGEGGAATLNANLTLNGVLTLNGALTMGSELTLGSGSTLANTGYAHISDITKDTEITLFSSVDSVTYGAASTALTSTEVDAHNVFGNLNTGDFTIRFDNGDVILKANNNVPEPTTATLSLLALMGLAARRRRKAAK